MSDVLQLKIELNEINPKIWRRFLIKDDITFQNLHDIIQRVMGWEDYHLYEFKIGNEIISSDEEGFNPAEGAFDKLFQSPKFIKMLEKQDLSKGGASLDVTKVNKILKESEKNQPKRKFDMNTKINELINPKRKKFNYRYDFGDNWIHTLVIEKRFDEKDVKECPICIEGERACPPEDCGGISGYEELIEMQKNKKHPDYEERIVDWLGEDFNFEQFDINEINRELKNACKRR